MRALLDRVARHREVEEVVAALELEPLLVGQVQEADEVEWHRYARLLLLTRHRPRLGPSRRKRRGNGKKKTVVDSVLFIFYRSQPTTTRSFQSGRRRQMKQKSTNCVRPDAPLDVVVDED